MAGEKSGKKGGQQQEKKKDKKQGKYKAKCGAYEASGRGELHKLARILKTNGVEAARAWASENSAMGAFERLKEFCPGLWAKRTEKAV